MYSRHRSATPANFPEARFSPVSEYEAIKPKDIGLSNPFAFSIGSTTKD